MESRSFSSVFATTPLQDVKNVRSWSLAMWILEVQEVSQEAANSEGFHQNPRLHFYKSKFLIHFLYRRPMRFIVFLASD